MLAVPLLAICIPLKVAAPLAVLLSITIAAIVVAQDWKKVHWRSSAWLVLSSVAGIPLGLLLLAGGHQQLAKAGLALIIIGCSAYFLIGRVPFHLQRDSRRWLLASGFCAGVLGGAYGMNGPPLAVYGMLRRWSPQHFRATLQGYFLVASLVGLFGYATAGILSATVSRYFVTSLPVVLVAILIGRALNRRLSGHGFFRVVYVGLVVIGAVLIAQAA